MSSMICVAVRVKEGKECIGCNKNLCRKVYLTSKPWQIYRLIKNLDLDPTHYVLHSRADFNEQILRSGYVKFLSA